MERCGYPSWGAGLNISGNFLIDLELQVNFVFILLQLTLFTKLIYGCPYCNYKAY